MKNENKEMEIMNAVLDIEAAITTLKKFDNLYLGEQLGQDTIRELQNRISEIDEKLSYSRDAVDEKEERQLEEAWERVWGYTR